MKCGIPGCLPQPFEDPKAYRRYFPICKPRKTLEWKSGFIFRELAEGWWVEELMACPVCAIRAGLWVLRNQTREVPLPFEAFGGTKWSKSRGLAYLADHDLIRCYGDRLGPTFLAEPGDWFFFPDSIGGTWLRVLLTLPRRAIRLGLAIWHEAAVTRNWNLADVTLGRTTRLQFRIDQKRIGHAAKALQDGGLALVFKRVHFEFTLLGWHARPRRLVHNGARVLGFGTDTKPVYVPVRDGGGKPFQMSVDPRKYHLFRRSHGIYA